MLRDELGQPITRKADAEKAKDKLMEIVAKKSQVESLRSIQHAIDDGAADIAALEEAQNPPLPLAQVWGAFLKPTGRNDCGKSTLGIYQGVWNRFLAWMQRERTSKTLLRDVDTKIAQAYLETLNRGQLGPATYNAHLLTLRYMFRVLKDEARLPENVWQKPKPKKLITQSRRELTIEELKKVCTSATGELRALLSIGVYSGLRIGDCATLRWCEVDLRRNQIQRIPRKTARRSPKPITIPIHPVLRGILADIPAKERGEFVLPETANTYLQGSPSLVTRVIQQHFIASGLKTTSAREEGQRPVVEVGFHSLRLSFVSMCREANVPLSVVETLVGHHSVDMTRHYTHVSQLAAANAIAQLPAMTGDADTARPANRAPAEILREMRGIWESLTAKNWSEKKAAALAMLAAV